MLFHLFISNRNLNENTYKYFNELRFPISFGISPDISLKNKFLNNCKVINMMTVVNVDGFPFVYFKQK